jgi:hypothetical protein
MSKAWLYNQENVSGKLFELGEHGKNSETYEELKEDGWLDSPKSLDKPKPEIEELTAERVESMSPDAMADQVKGYGYHVLTEIELQVKISKAISDVSDDALCAEVDKRGLKRDFKADEEISYLKDKFLTNPKSLIIEQHLALGKALGVKLRINFGEDTMIKKIQAKLDEA